MLCQVVRHLCVTTFLYSGSCIVHWFNWLLYNLFVRTLAKRLAVKTTLVMSVVSNSICNKDRL